MDETGHFGFRHRHRLAVSAVDITVLQGRRLFNNLVQGRFQFVNKQKVVEDRNFLYNPLSPTYYLPRLHRCKNFHAYFRQLSISREFRIRTFQVAHHKPLLKTRTLILQERLKLYLSTSSNNSRKKFGDFTSPFSYEEKHSICCSTERIISSSNRGSFLEFQLSFSYPERDNNAAKVGKILEQTS